MFLRVTGRAVSVALASLSLMAAAPEATPSPGLKPVSDVEVRNGRISVVMFSRPAAGYFELDNHGAAPLMLTGASTPGCGSLTLHRTLNAGGTARMEAVKQVAVPAQGSVAFKPGGYHLMCMQPAQSLKPGGTAPVTLRFADGGSETAQFAVVGPLDR